MRLVAVYSFKDGREFINARLPGVVEEVKEIIGGIDAFRCRTKKSREKTMRGRVLFSPKRLNLEFKTGFGDRGWTSIRERCSYRSDLYVAGYEGKPLRGRPYREMDFVKDRVGVEIQFGKYSFMVYNVCAKMSIFRNLGYIECGIEIVPVKALQAQMSTGVSYFEQFVWDLDRRGEADIDVPVLILGIDA